MATERANKGGRPANLIKNEKVSVYVTADVALYWRMRFWDDFSQQLKKGEMSKLVDRLLRDEMNRELGK